MDISLKSDVGKKRKLDEDSIAIMDYSRSYESKRREMALFALADGAGGEGSGEVCSKITLRTVMGELSDFMVEEFQESNYKDVENRLEQAVEKSHQKVIERAKTDSSVNKGMASTLSLVLVSGYGFYYASVGDSRIYVLDDEIEQVSTDDSLVRELVEKGELTPEEARHDDRKNVITEAIGGGKKQPPDIETGWHSLYKDQLLLVCCDGVTDVLRDKEVYEIIEGNRTDLSSACDEIVSEANARGGPDNISLILAKPDYLSKTVRDVINSETIESEEFFAKRTLQKSK